jgi:hypothetical protein
MDIHNEDGGLDFEKAVRELKSANGMNNPEQGRRNVVAIQTAALIDIADSLRTLALEAGLAMAHRGDLNLGTHELDEGIQEDRTSIESFAVLGAPKGARVTIDQGDRITAGTLTGEVGVDQGAAWAEVIIDGADVAARVWADRITSVTAPTPSGESMPSDDREPPSFEPPAVSEADDLDADFDGDEHPEADDALAALKAREKAARKPKGGKK